MIKYLFILFNSFAVFVIGLFSSDGGIKLSSDLPSSMNVGKEIAVEFKINKGDLGGFGRFVLSLPEGFSIANVDEKGAEYTFEENKAKWVWAALPTDQEMSIKLTLVAQEAALGEKEISAKFSYLENNEKQFVDLEPVKINVLAANSIPVTETPAPVQKTDSATTAAPQTTSNAEPPGKIYVERTTQWVEAEKAYHVVIQIKKGNTKGFARYSDDAHENLSAKATKTDGSSFSIADGKIKFVWVNVPDKEVLEVAYTLSGKPNKPISLNGEYSYLEDNQSKKVLLSAELLNFQSRAVQPPVATNPPKEKEVKPDSTEPVKAVETPTETVKQQTKQGDATFHVQVGAFTNSAITAARIKSKFSINETVRSEMAEGFTKFLIGSHNEYKTARQHRDVMKNTNGVKTAFVVAYMSSKRITVQEALMVTNQKWFK